MYSVEATENEFNFHEISELFQEKPDDGWRLYLASLFDKRIGWISASQGKR